MKQTRRIDLFSDITEIPAVLDQKTYPSLNGFRAVSIIMVLCQHFIMHYNGYFQHLIFIGPLGVDIFFVISGFLITTLCIKEKIITKDLSLKNFYIRRALRILPVAFLYIAVIAILNPIFNLHISFISFLSSALLIANLSYFKNISFDWDLAHYWSLSTEEQFYLFLPVFLKKNFRIYVSVLLIIIVVAPITAYLQTLVPFINTGLVTAMLHYLIKFQGIATGCLFSILLFKNKLNFGSFRLPVTLLSIFVIFYVQYDSAYNLRSCFTNLIVSVFVGFIIINNISPRKDLIYKFLNLKFLGIIGILSYSIYIWQQLFMSNDPNFPLSRFPVNVIFVILVPVLSYFYYEKYFLTLKARFTKKTARQPAD